MTISRTKNRNSLQTSSSRVSLVSNNLPKLEALPQISAEQATEFLCTMQQGMVVWNKNGECEFFNQQMLELNETAKGQIRLGYKRTDLLQRALKRGTKDSISLADLEKKFASGKPFVFDRYTRSGRTIIAAAQPRKCGGHVVTFADVTYERLYEGELAEAKREADEAKERAQMALTQGTKRKRQSKLLGELGEWLQSCKSLDELYKVIARFMESLFVGSSGELFVYSNSRDVLESACFWNQTAERQHIHADDCWALRRGRIFKYGFGLVDCSCSHIDETKAEKFDAECASRYICLPIIAHGDTVGLLHIEFTNCKKREQESQEANEETVSFGIQCAEQISLAVANVRLRDELRDQSTKDPLTGLYNRRYFLDSCRNAFGAAQRNGKSVGVISFDADNFKHFNDNHGHDAGDMVLRAISDVMQSHCVEHGTPCRYGGEEFTIVLPDSDAKITLEFAERLRKAVSELSIRYGDSVLPKVSISVGVATYPQFGINPQEVLSAADKALYNAKHLGKNIVVEAGKMDGENAESVSQICDQ